MLWEKLLNKDTLIRGYHLAKEDLKKSFTEELYLADSFTNDHTSNINEILRQLGKGTYHPKPLVKIDIPKNPLSVRPGAVLCFEDSIVLHAIMFLIAERFEQGMSESVYSYRLKAGFKDGKNKQSMFKDSDVLDLPYLKRKTVSKHIDPFEPWYANWPEFDDVSRKAFTERGHRFLAVSDIAAYFENIQIPILRDQLLRALPDDPRIVNLLISFFESWAAKTDEGRSQWRGIPQGNCVSSFLGNIFLMKVDTAFHNFQANLPAGAVEYYRYMDDIRIFTKEEADARKAILLLEKTLRDLHLNVQSAKTKILREEDLEITGEILDSRLEYLNDYMEKIKGRISPKQKKEHVAALNKIASMKPPYQGRQKIIGSGKKRAFKGLDSRLFRRWCGAHLQAGSNYFMDRLAFEIKNAPDHRMTLIAAKALKRFPEKQKFALELFKYIKSELNIFKHQEAELIRSFRYLSNIPVNIVDYCKENAVDENVHAYIRVQSIYLLGRVELKKADLKKIEIAFGKEQNEQVLLALTSLLIRYTGEKNGEMLRILMYHPNSKVSSIGKYFRNLKWDAKAAQQKISYIFNEKYDVSVKICDNLSVLLHIGHATHSSMYETRKSLLNYLKKHKDAVTRIGLRPLLNKLHNDISIELGKFDQSKPGNDNQVIEIIKTRQDLVNSVKEDF